MSTKVRWIRRASAAWLSAAMLSLSVAVPVMERADVGERERWESSHAPGACTRAHDHTVCTQVGSNLSLPSTTVHHAAAVRLSRGTDSGRPVLTLGRIRTEGHPTRAPPST